MVDFSEIQPDTPRLEVVFRQEDERVEFQWRMGGSMPLMDFIGAIVQVQTFLCEYSDYDLWIKGAHDCPEQMLVIAWDKEARQFSWFAHEDMPIMAMIGMLEMIKYTLISTHLARQMASQQLIVGPDGNPFRR